MDVTTALDDWDTGCDLRGYRRVPEQPHAAVLVVHGFGEYAERHAVTMNAWAARGIACYAYDHRGHGRSPGKRAIVDRFDDLVDDSLAMRERVAAEVPSLPLFLFGVSMGGAVATRSAQRRSDGLRGVVLLAPGFAVAEHIPPLLRTILRGLRRIAPHAPLQALDVSKLSRDPAVGEAYAQDAMNYHGGVPLSTGDELMRAGDAAIAEAPEYTVPTLLFQGDADAIVFSIGAARFVDAAKSNRDLTYTVVPGGYHELFNDPGGADLAATAAEWILARSVA